MNTITLYRPVNYVELELIEKSNWKKFPPRLPEQPIFYPVLNVDYARQITMEWNMPAYGVGYVTAFEVNADHLRKFEVQNVGADMHDEFWIPSEDLEEFNNNIIGTIRVVETYHIYELFFEEIITNVPENSIWMLNCNNNDKEIYLLSKYFTSCNDWKHPQWGTPMLCILINKESTPFILRTMFDTVLWTCVIHQSIVHNGLTIFDSYDTFAHNSIDRTLYNKLVNTGSYKQARLIAEITD